MQGVSLRSPHGYALASAAASGVACGLCCLARACSSGKDPGALGSHDAGAAGSPCLGDSAAGPCTANPAAGGGAGGAAPHSPRTEDEHLTQHQAHLTHLDDGRTQWSDPRMGITVVYDTTTLHLQQPIHRSDPFAVLVFDVLSEQGCLPPTSSNIGTAVTVQVHDVSGEDGTDEPTYLESYVQKSLSALELEDELLEVEERKATTLDRLPALHFFYCCTDGDGVDRKVYSIVTQRDNNAVVSVSYSSPKGSFASLDLVKRFVRDIRIRAPEFSESSLTFTDPKYGISLQVRASEYHVETTAAEGGSSWREIVQFSSSDRPGGGGASILRLEAEPADLPVIDMDEHGSSPTHLRWQKSSVSALRYAAQLYRQQVQADPACPEGAVQWTRLDADESRGGALIPTEKGRKASADILNSLTRSVTLKGPQELDAITFSYTKRCSSDTVLCFVVYMWLVRGDLFVLSSVCLSEERVNVASALFAVANTVRYGEEHGQTASLQYYCPMYQFSLLLPTGLRAFEPFVGDPHVAFCIPSSAKESDGKGHDRKSRLLREFYMHVRVQSVGDCAENEGLEEALVNEMAALAAQGAAVHSNRLTQLAGLAALELVFSAHNDPLEGCAALAMPPPGKATTLRMITIHKGTKYTLDFIASVNYFPGLVKGLCAEILGSFSFDTRATK